MIAALVALVVFWRTAYPTITWWDSSNYSLAANTLGLTSSPGSLLLTLIGWVVTRPVGPGSIALTLNLLAGALGAIAVSLVVVVTVRIGRLVSADGTPGQGIAAAAAVVGALTFAFSVTLWEHATKFTPYVLTVVFTGLILLALVRWWEAADQRESYRWLALLTFLFGLDFSVHRTNALLIPGAIAWILIRRPRTLIEPRAWAGAFGGMLLGLSFHLLVMPISSITTSPLNMFQPDTWARFWDYVSLAQTGGNFQLDVFARNSPLWSNQAADLLRMLAANLAHSGSAVGVAGWLPALVGVIGVVFMWRRSPRFALAFLLLLVLQASATIVYFNIPAGYFRSLDRHYLPVLMTIAVAVSMGAVAVSQHLVAFSRSRPVLAAPLAGVLVLLPLVQLTANWNVNDASRRFFTRDFAVNALQALPPRAFYFTVGDNDTFPALYVQTVERVRTDVRIVNLSLANTAWYIDQIRSRDSAFPVKGTPDERRAANAATWKDSALVVRLTGSEDALVRGDSRSLDSVVFRPVPSMGNQLLPADDVMLDIVRSSAFTTPVTVASTAGSSGLSWLAPYARVDGLHWRVVPFERPLPDRAVLRANLLERNEYRGYADSTIVLDDVTRRMGQLYRDAFNSLLSAEAAAGNVAECIAMATRIEGWLPASRLRLAGTPVPALRPACGA